MGKNKIIQNWQIKKLGEVCKIIMGQSPPSDTYNENAKGMPFFQGKAEFKDLYPVVKKYCSKPTKIAEPLDILLSVRAPVGTTNIANIQCCIGRGLAAIRFDNYKYGFYFLRSIQHELDSKGTGTTFRAISGETIRETLIPYPNQETQHAIVSKIEELFSELDKGIAELKTAQQQLKTYRQSVLKSAFEGKLTNENVKDGELPDDWEIKKLNQVAKIISGFAFKSSDFISKGIPVVKISNIGYSEFIWKDQQYLPEKFLISNSDFILKNDDLLIALTRPITNNTTKICLYPKNTNIGLLNQRVACIKEIQLNKKYLFLYFQTNNFKEYIRTKFSETLQPNLSPKDLAITPIPLPSPEEQNRIVQEIESRLSVADKMEQSIQESLQKAETLRQSILKKAFCGELV